MSTNTELRPTYTKSQLAILCGISLRTFQRRLAKSGIEVPRGLIAFDQALIITSTLGYAALLSRREV